MLLRVRRARRDLDWILTRRKAQIATCRRGVKNDKADKALRAKAKREEMEKLAVAPPTETTNEASSPNRQTRERDAFDAREERDACEKNAMHRFSNLARDDANDTRTRIANVHRDASVPAVAAHRRGSLAHVVSRRGSVRDLAGFPTHRRGSVRNRRGSVARLPGDDDEDEPRGRFGSLENARENVSRVGARTSSPNARFASRPKACGSPRASREHARGGPPAALTMHKNGARREVASVARTFTRREGREGPHAACLHSKHSREGLPREARRPRRSASFVHVRPSRRTAARAQVKHRHVSAFTSRLVLVFCHARMRAARAMVSSLLRATIDRRYLRRMCTIAT